MATSKIVVKKVFLLTGRRNWGKSRTLSDSAFAGTKRTIVINGNTVFVKKMSNGDKPQSLLAFVKKTNKPYLAIAFCCDAGRLGQLIPVPVLTTLQRRGYKLYSFILEHQYPFPHAVISANEKAMMHKYTKDFIYSRKNAPSSVRAAEFKRYIQKNIP